METDCSITQVFDEGSTNPQELKRRDSEKSIARKNSFVWNYYNPSQSNGLYECILCGSCVGNLTSNLARHLLTSHNIKNGEVKQGKLRGRPSRSFIWKYCTKEDAKYARCHSCEKLLYFGGGNTANIAKHLRRKHSHIINKEELGNTMSMDEKNEVGSTEGAVTNGEVNMKEICVPLPRERRERKGSSYVWSYCDKLTRHTVRCKLCGKIMSFHGTANVITHLQRKHNIVGRMDSSATLQSINEDEKNISFDSVDESIEDIDRRRRRSSTGTSNVWKYCTRVGPDLVRCSFCKKELSFQGTSNVQRHLHRMHGIGTQGRINSDEYILAEYDDESFIWEYCSQNEEFDIKCSMCNFECKDTREIIKHLRVVHAVQSHNSSKHRRKSKSPKSKDEESSDEFNDDGNDTANNNASPEKWHKSDEEDPQYLNDSTMKKEVSYFDEIIEEDQGEQISEALFDPNAIQDIPIANPLSAQSSRDSSPVRKEEATFVSKSLRKLNEERLRMETEYLREKAAFYRMQKYLTALQAKKLRAELERLHGGTYTVNINLSESSITPE